MSVTYTNGLNERRAAGLEGEEIDSGFTLIELMVVLLILAILLAIAIPTFLGVTNSANDRASQSNLNTGLTDAKSIYENNSQKYPASAALEGSIATNEPSLPLTSTAAIANAGQVAVQVSVDGAGTVIVALAKKTNECWWVADNTSAISPTVGTDPWITGATTTGTQTTGGIPLAAGEWYGVYNVKTNAVTTCSAALAGVGTAKSNISSTGFPAAA